LNKIFDELVVLANIFICVDDQRIAELSRCKEIIVVDVDDKTIVDRFQNPVQSEMLDVLEDLLDKYDPIIFFTCGVDEENAYLLEENGVHVYIDKCIEYNNVLEKIYGFKV